METIDSYIEILSFDNYILSSKVKQHKAYMNDIGLLCYEAIKEYDVNKGDKKYPKDPTAVTILIAIVLFDKGKCLPTIDIGILMAVPPRPIPTKRPISI